MELAKRSSLLGNRITRKMAPGGIACTIVLGRLANGSVGEKTKRRERHEETRNKEKKRPMQLDRCKSCKIRRKGNCGNDRFRNYRKTPIPRTLVSLRDCYRRVRMDPLIFPPGQAEGERKPSTFLPSTTTNRRAARCEPALPQHGRVSVSSICALARNLSPITRKLENSWSLSSFLTSGIVVFYFLSLT